MIITKLKDITVDNIATYPTPGISAVFQGRSVRLIAAGNAPGHSPVVQFVETDGTLGWAKETDITICDTSYLPPATAGLQRAFALLKATNG